VHRAPRLSRRQIGRGPALAGPVALRRTGRPVRLVPQAGIASARSHVGGSFAGEKVLARRREDVDDLGVLRKPRLVLDASRDDADVAGPARALLVAEPEVHASRHHPEDLLVRMAMGGGVGARLHRPPDDHPLLAGQHAAADLVGDLLLGQALELVIALHQSHRAAPLARRERGRSLTLSARWRLSRTPTWR